MKKLKVLLADDDPDFRQAIQVTMEQDGYEVITAEDGTSALEEAFRTVPDVIILDVMMPGKDGFAVCHDIRKHPKTANVPVIMLTSLGNKKDGKNGAEFLATGHAADAYLEKPVKPETLTATVRSVIENKEKPEAAVKSRILLIDDDPDFIAAVKTILDEQNYEVHVSYTGEDGLREAAAGDPDLILLDVMLPGMDGFAVCKELKESQKTRLIPVIMLTSVGEKLTEPDYAEALAVTHRADDYIQKPVDAKKLIDHIQNQIGPKRRLV